MILTGIEIHREFLNGKIEISPFKKERVTTNSYDLELGRTYIRYTSFPLDVKKPSQFETREIPEEGLVLNAGEFILAETAERIGSDHYVPLIHAKSGTARAGLFVHVTADLIDIGSHGKSTLQLYATLPIRIYPGMLLAQVTFWKPEGEIELYQGKYQNSKGPMPSLVHNDYGK